MYIGLHVKLYVILARFSWNLNPVNIFSKNNQITNIMKILSVGAGLFHTDGRTDRQIYITKLIVTFRNFANGRKKKEIFLTRCLTGVTRTKTAVPGVCRQFTPHYHN